MMGYENLTEKESFNLSLKGGPGEIQCLTIGDVRIIAKPKQIEKIRGYLNKESEVKHEIMVY